MEKTQARSCPGVERGLGIGWREERYRGAAQGRAAPHLLMRALPSRNVPTRLAPPKRERVALSVEW